MRVAVARYEYWLLLLSEDCLPVWRVPRPPGVPCEGKEAMLLTERYQKLSPWLCSPMDRASRTYLETHLDLLSDESDQFLEMFIAEHKDMLNERQRLHLMRHLLRDATTRGGTPRAVREAYVNLFGGLILDPPAWLREIEQQWQVAAETGWTARRMTVCKLSLRQAIARAQTDPEISPEIEAELHYQLGNFFANDQAGSVTTIALERAVECYTSALRVYTAECYPLRCARILLSLGDVYRRMAEDRQADLILKSLSYYTRALAIYGSFDLV